ncbi:MAG TPA: HEAT repeat domain-containing protein [Gemmataceae bacterium]
MGRSRRLLVLVLLLVGGCGKGSTVHWIEQLKSPESLRRLEAVHTLQERKGEAAEIIPALMEALQDENTHVRRDVARALGSFGEEAKNAVPALQTALRDREPGVRRAAGIALSRIDPKLGSLSRPHGARGK